MKFTTRTYNSVEFNRLYGTIIKSSTTDKLQDEIEYYNHIPDTLKPFFPRILSAGFVTVTNRWCIVMDYYPGYKSLGDYMTDGALSREQWVSIARKLGAILQLFSNYHPFDTSERIQYNVCRTRMFIDKTITEYDNLQKFPELRRLMENSTIFINNASYKNFNVVWPEIKEQIDKRLITNIPFSFIHGDFCFANILCGFVNDEPVFKFIDPRGSFGAKGVYGDPIYDFAKLMHSYAGGYEFIINDHFTQEHEDNRIHFTIGRNDQRAVIKDVFYNEFFGMKNGNVNAMLVEGLLFISMCARHYDSLDRQKVMYATGVQILNDVLGYL